jgi:hypothetical protein
MEKCQVKKGIFVLSTCDSPSAIKCDNCSISICNKHSKQDGPQVLCMDCFAKAHPDNFGTTKKGLANRLEDDYYGNYNAWYFGTRYHFYNTSHYSPFTRDDYRTFDTQHDRDLTDDQNSGSFFDS